MSQKKQTQKELSNGQSFAVENTSNSQLNSQLIENEKIDTTPFYLTGNENEGYVLRLGKYKIIEAEPTKDEALNQLYEEDWNIIFRMIGIMIEINEEMNKIQ